MTNCEVEVEIVLVDGLSIDDPDTIRLHTTPEAYDLATIEIGDHNIAVSIDDLRNALNAIDAANGR